VLTHVLALAPEFCTWELVVLDRRRRRRRRRRGRRRRIGKEAK
jgi:hypothetical protein